MNQESKKSSHNTIHRVKKADIILIVGCLLAAAFLSVFFIIHRKTGIAVHILCDGTELKILTIDSSQTNSAEAADGYYLITFGDDVARVEYFAYKPEFKIAEGTSYNLLSVAGGTVVMEEADCKDRICVHHKPISSARESIICLPHRLVVEIAGDDAAVDTRKDGQGGDSEETSYGSLDGVVR